MAIKSWSYLTIAGIVFLLLAPLLVWFTLGLVRGNRTDTFATLPLMAEQEINLSVSGPVIVLMELPNLATDFRNFQIEMTEKQTGRSETMKYSYLGSQGAVHDFSTVKLPFGRLTANSGAYVVKVTGMEPGKNYAEYHVILSRPYLGRMAFQIAGIVVCGVGMLLCVIWAAWQAGLMKQGTNSSPTTGAGVPGHTIDLETWKRQQQNPPK